MQSFFNLTFGPSVPEDDNLAYQASLTPKEREVFLDESEALCNALLTAIDAYTETHPETSIGVCLDAAKCLAYCFERQLAEEACDA